MSRCVEVKKVERSFGRNEYLGARYALARNGSMRHVTSRQIKARVPRYLTFPGMHFAEFYEEGWYLKSSSSYPWSLYKVPYLYR